VRNAAPASTAPPLARAQAVADFLVEELTQPGDFRTIRIELREQPLT